MPEGLHAVFSLEAIRLGVIIGVIISMLVYERLQLTTGGAIVPGYLAAFWAQPSFIAISLFTAYATYYVVNRVIARRWILYGRRKFEVEILVGLAFVGVGLLASTLLVPWSPHLLALAGVGFVIPGIIAHDMNRQKPRKTILVVLGTTALVGVIMYVYQALVEISPWPGALESLWLAESGFAYPRDQLLLGVVVSVLVGMLVFHRLGLRTGGFIMGAFIALVVLRPLDLLFAVALTAITYLLVTRVLMKQMLLFGRRKLSMMVLVAAVLTWAAEILVVELTGARYIPWQGFGVITLFVPALLANDAQRQGMTRTLLGAGITTAAVFALMNLVYALRLLWSTEVVHLTAGL